MKLLSILCPFLPPTSFPGFSHTSPYGTREREREPGNEVVLPHVQHVLVGKYCVKLVLFLPTIGRSTPVNINWFQGGICVIYLMHLIKKWKQNEIFQKAVEWLKIKLWLVSSTHFWILFETVLLVFDTINWCLTPPPPNPAPFIGPPFTGLSICKQKNTYYWRPLDISTSLTCT